MMVQSLRRFPRYGFLGLALIAAGWPLSWLKPEGFGFLSRHAFLLLWIGYILVVDALVYARKGTSLWRRSRRRFLGLFAISAPAWWLFEFFNHYLQNWEYIGTGEWTGLSYFLTATAHFTIVTPAVLETAELWGTAAWLQRLSLGPRVSDTPRALTNMILIGVVAVVAVITAPRYAFPLVWLSVYLILDPINHLRGRPSLIASLRQGDWRPVIALWLAGLTCGFFWEMWNYYALPKWVYHVPFVSFLHVFEMPILGYGGYLPFAMEVYALYQLALDLAGIPEGGYVRLIDEAAEVSRRRPRVKRGYPAMSEG
ncbi:MAG TPA: hypothetical protein G4O02_09890 [Caldilineae bacterium]|nr:hypothetical protein [Caldilineae bacterium]